MIEYIKGELIDLTPANAIIETNGIGYSINISLVTYAELTGSASCKLYVYEAIRDDAFILYGFKTQEERTLFLQLISVSGVGPNTARMIMSSLSASELQEAISTDNVAILRSVKGIGLKTAERIIVDLRDKVTKTTIENGVTSLGVKSAVSEAVSALVMLGFQQAASQKVVDKLAKDEPALSLEKLVKRALQML